jgi:hypothetical protein
MVGRVVGLRALTGALRGAADVVPATVAARRAIRDYNDMPTGRIMGSAGGRLVQGARPDLGDLGGETEEEEAFTAAKQQGRENREYYRRTVGTPKRRPMSGGFGDDFSDLGRATP